ncbi:uncharacterized protein RJT21DRAFT_113522 [Scheffersomyces amazonensis]|uniref:uncharacterized protein n=1 Tax=Scheffersomyces amazonensis TaxID=1078765 RepID=UPI00315D7270
MTTVLVQDPNTPILLSPCDSAVTLNIPNSPCFNSFNTTNSNSIYKNGTTLSSVLNSNNYYDQQQFHQQLIQTFLQSRLSDTLNQQSQHLQQVQHQKDIEICLLYHEQNQIPVKLSSVLNLINTFLHQHNGFQLTSIDDLTINHLLIYLYYNQRTIFPELDSVAYINHFSLLHLGKCFKFAHAKINIVYITKLNITQFSTFLLNITPSGKDSPPSIYRYFNINNYLCESLDININHSHSTKSFLNMLKKSRSSNNQKTLGSLEATKMNSSSSETGSSQKGWVSTTTMHSNNSSTSTTSSQESTSLSKLKSNSSVSSNGKLRRSLKRFFSHRQ